jgi:hypothetical protein
MLAAVCFGTIFGAPFIVWGIILIVDRDRSWQRKVQRSKRGSTPRRSVGWDRRQIAYGTLLVILGLLLLFLFSAFNYLLQSISPPAPF